MLLAPAEPFARTSAHPLPFVRSLTAITSRSNVPWAPLGPRPRSPFEALAPFSSCRSFLVPPPLVGGTRYLRHVVALGPLIGGIGGLEGANRFAFKI